METRSAKRKRLLNTATVTATSAPGKDRLSDLPDSVLHHILFLLPIKSIARLSLLSKRFKSLWVTFPDLDFTTAHNPFLHSQTSASGRRGKRINSKPATRTDFIHQALSLRDKNADLRTLRFAAQLTFSRLSNLIRLAVRHKVQYLDVEVATNDYFNFPRSVIGSQYLRVFKLKSRSPGFRLLPAPTMKTGFQSLRTLALSRVMLYEQSSLHDLFTESSFPLLKNLSLDECYGLKKIRVECRAITDLTLEKCFQLVELSVCCGKLEKLRVASCFDAYNVHSCVRVRAPRLRVISWECNAITENSWMENLTSLEEASVGFFLLHEDITSAKCWTVSNFLSGLSHAHSFTLDSQCVEILSKNNHFASVILQPFNNLKTLELRTGFYKHNIHALACLFRSSPILHTLTIKIINDYKERRQWNRELWDLASSGEEQYWESQSQALKSFLHHLKVVRIHGFSECENDISLAKFLLKHGKGLQEMTLCSGHDNCRDTLRRERIKSHMMEFSRASSNAKVAFR